MYPPPTKEKVVTALEALKHIPRPDGDNEGDPINSPGVYNSLTSENQERVDYAKEITSEYLRKPGDEGDEPNKRSIRELKKAGFPAFLQPDQDDRFKLVGGVEVGEWKLDVSDPGVQRDDD